MSPIRVGFLLLSAISALTAQDNSLRITTVSALPPAIVGATYLQALSASGGTPPYTWALISGTLPPGINVSTDGTVVGVANLLGSASVTIQVTDKAGARVSQSFVLAVIAAAGVSRFGVFSHITAGGSWNTAITLVNSSLQAVVPVRLNFYADDGTPLKLPLSVSQQGSSQTFTVSGLDGALNPSTGMVISTGTVASLVTGWVEVLSPGPLTGFAIFRTVPASGAASEGAVTLQTQSPSSILLPYDNTAGYVMGVALTNPSPDNTDLTATVWDDNGTQLSVQTISLKGKNHSSFVMPTLLPSTTGKRGIVRFQNTGTGGIAAIGLRFTSVFTFTSVPVAEGQ